MNRRSIFLILILLLSPVYLISYETHYYPQVRSRLCDSYRTNSPAHQKTVSRMHAIRQCIQEQKSINRQRHYVQQQQVTQINPTTNESISLASVQQKQAEAAARTRLSHQSECIIKELRPSFNSQNIHQPFVGAINMVGAAIDKCRRPDVKSLIFKMGLFDDLLITSSLASHGCIDQFGTICYHLFDEYSTHYHHRVKRIVRAVVNRLGHPHEIVTDLVKGMAHCGLFLVDAVICGIAHGESADKKICDLIESMAEQIACLTEEELDDFVGTTTADMIATWGMSRIPSALKKFSTTAVSQKALQTFARITELSTHGTKRLCDFFKQYIPPDKLSLVTDQVPASLMRSVDESMCVIGKGGKELIKVGTYAITPELTAAVEDLLNVTAHLESELPVLEQLFSNTRKGFAECADKYIKIPFRHLLSVELDVNNLGIPRITGFHHDVNGLIEKSGIVKFGEKVYDKFGCYKADITFNEALKRGNTFFPFSWSQEKVINKILEAYDNFIGNGFKNFKVTERNTYRIKCYTNEGIKIEMYITKKGRITSAYPLIKS